MIDDRTARAHRAGIPVEVLTRYFDWTRLDDWHENFIYVPRDYRITPGIEVRAGSNLAWAPPGTYDFKSNARYEWRPIASAAPLVGERFNDATLMQIAAVRPDLLASMHGINAPPAAEQAAPPQTGETDDENWHVCSDQTATFALAPPQTPEPVAWRDMASAPLDNTLVRLLVKFDNHGIEDSDEPTASMGHCCDGEWNFVGWDWYRDEWTRGSGDLLGWLPMLTPEQAAPLPQGADAWVGVDERLPYGGTRCVVASREGVESAWFDESEFVGPQFMRCVLHNMTEEIERVTHWMPLPGPPKAIAAIAGSATPP